MTFTATPQPANIPPRVRMDFDTDDPLAFFSTLSVTRDGKSIREQPVLGGTEAFAFDYEMPFGVPVTYHATGTFVLPVDPDWTESWASLAAWSGDTGSFSVASGNASSSVINAKITRDATGEIQRLSVTNPVYVRVEFLNSVSIVVASVEVTDKVTVTGSTTPVQVTGSGTFDVTLSADTIAVNGSGWSVTNDYDDTATKVRVVSLGTAYIESLNFSAIGSPRGVRTDSSGNIYVVDHGNKLVRKYNSSGTQIVSGNFPFSTTGDPRGIALDSSGNIYVTDSTNNRVRKFTSAGAASANWSTTDFPYGIFIDSSDVLFVSTAKTGANKIRRYTTSGSSGGGSFTAAGTPRDVAVASSGNVYYVNTDDNSVRKLNSSGTQLANYAIGVALQGIAVDSAENFYVTSQDERVVRKYNSSGTYLTQFPVGGRTYGVTVGSAGNLYSTEYSTYSVRKFDAVAASVGQITETPTGAEQLFDESATVQLDATQAWLIHPSQPSLSVSIDPGPGKFRDDGINVDITSSQQVSRAATSTIHNPVGRTRDVVITNGNRREGKWTLVLLSGRLEDRDAIVSITADQTPLLLRSPSSFGWDLRDDWYSVADVTVDRLVLGLAQNWRRTTLPLTPVDEPIVRRGTLRNYGDLLAESADYAGLPLLYDTYLDMLAG